MSETDNKKIVERFLKAVETGDATLIEKTQASNCTWWILGHGDMSREDYTTAVKSMLLSAKSRKVDIIGMVAEGETVTAEIRSAIDFGGRVYRNEYHDLFVLKDGLIVHGREYMNTMAVADFFGKAGPST
jgi:uncharacterized protein